MAKKVKKASKKSGSKSSKKATKPSKAKKAPSRSDLDPVPVNTGKGATPAEIGASLVTMFNNGEMDKIEKKWWNNDEIVSIEGVGVSLAWIGEKAVRAKGAEWMADNQIHGASAEGPYVGATGFAVKFVMDVTTKSTGERRTMTEIGVYTVEDGKIVIEEFMYSA